MVNEGTSEWCRDWRPPPLPPEDSDLFRELYHFMKSNHSHWENFQSYYELCNISLPVEPASTRSIARASNAAVPIIISLLIIVAVIIIAFVIWRLKRRKKGRASLPLREYEATNYLDNKARYNQCWNKSRMVQPPDPGGNTDIGSLDQTKQVLEVEPACNSKILTNTSKLFLATGALNNENRKGSSVGTNIENHDNKIGCQNLSFATDSDEKLPASPGASSEAPLFDDIDGCLLPNVPQINNSGTAAKKGNDYMKFPQVIPSKECDILQGPLPPIVDIKQSHSSQSPSFRRKKKKSSITDTRVSEPLKNTSLISEDLIENRKSV